MNIQSAYIRINQGTNTSIMGFGNVTCDVHCGLSHGSNWRNTLFATMTLSSYELEILWFGVKGSEKALVTSANVLTLRQLAKSSIKSTLLTCTSSSRLPLRQYASFVVTHETRQGTELRPFTSGTLNAILTSSIPIKINKHTC